MNLRHFSEEEFTRATPSCSLSDMNIGFMVRLVTARDLAGCPFIVNSAFRSKEYELRKKRSGNSMHCQGRAVDLSCKDSSTRYRIIKAALQAGFHGIGIGRTFIHLDDRDTLTIWLYD